jgi:hypothetical protein
MPTDDFDPKSVWDAPADEEQETSQAEKEAEQKEAEQKAATDRQAELDAAAETARLETSAAYEKQLRERQDQALADQQQKEEEEKRRLAEEKEPENPYSKEDEPEKFYAWGQDRAIQRGIQEGIEKVVQPGAAQLTGAVASLAKRLGDKHLAEVRARFKDPSHPELKLIEKDFERELANLPPGMQVVEEHVDRLYEMCLGRNYETINQERTQRESNPTVADESGYGGGHEEHLEFILTPQIRDTAAAFGMTPQKYARQLWERDPNSVRLVQR